MQNKRVSVRGRANEWEKCNNENFTCELALKTVEKQDEDEESFADNPTPPPVAISSH